MGVCRRAGLAAVVVLGLATGSQAQPAGARPFMDSVQRAAVRYFWERADPTTGLVTDRASNSGKDDYRVASMAATGFGLAALPIAVERGWLDRTKARDRATITLRTMLSMPQVHGFVYHFVDVKTCERQWGSEVSTIDTALCAAGALVCGTYFGPGPIRDLADRFYARIDWRWALTNDGAKPDKKTLSHGWRPESGFIPYEWDSYCEHGLLYLLAMGARDGAGADSWAAWQRPIYQYGGRETIAGGPIFWHQMTQCFYDLRGRRDALGFDYWVASEQAVDIQRAFCAANAAKRKTYREGYWGLNAGDASGHRYMAYGVPSPEDGTVSPTGALASIMFRPKDALQTAMRMKGQLGARAWGRYGFCNQLNLDEDWFGPDVIGIDLGMALLAVENHRSGLIWRLMSAHSSTAPALSKAGLRVTKEPKPRRLRLVPPGRSAGADGYRGARGLVLQAS